MHTKSCRYLLLLVALPFLVAIIAVASPSGRTSQKEGIMEGMVAAEEQIAETIITTKGTNGAQDSDEIESEEQNDNGEGTSSESSGDGEEIEPPRRGTNGDSTNTVVVSQSVRNGSAAIVVVNGRRRGKREVGERGMEDAEETEEEEEGEEEEDWGSSLGEESDETEESGMSAESDDGEDEPDGSYADEREEEEDDLTGGGGARCSGEESGEKGGGKGGNTNSIAINQKVSGGNGVISVLNHNRRKRSLERKLGSNEKRRHNEEGLREFVLNREFGGGRGSIAVKIAENDRMKRECNEIIEEGGKWSPL